jgi:hypothetical protein
LENSKEVIEELPTNVQVNPPHNQEDNNWNAAEDSNPQPQTAHQGITPRMTRAVIASEKCVQAGAS